MHFFGLIAHDVVYHSPGGDFGVVEGLYLHCAQTANKCPVARGGGVFGPEESRMVPTPEYSAVRIRFSRGTSRELPATERFLL